MSTSAAKWRRAGMALTLCILAVLPICNAIKCFECNSSNNSKCLTLTANDTDSEFYRECNGDYDGRQPFCRKLTQTIIDRQIVLIRRSCGWISNNSSKTCMKTDDDFHLERSCECFTDGCNSAPSTSSALWPIGVVGVFTLIKLIRQ